jgi:FMN-dependent NADH-azoreductase
MTTAILQILVSPRPTSISRRVAREIGERVAAQRPGTRVIERDLAADPPPQPGLELYEAILSPTPDDDPRFTLSEQMIAELEAADFVVIGTPMNNFTVPSTLKACAGRKRCAGARSGEHLDGMPVAAAAWVS